MIEDSGPVDGFRVLAVCTANRYRSPLVEHLLRAVATSAGLRWQVGSAGTLARPGEPLDAATATQLAERGVAPSGWRSRRLEAALVADADLIVAADGRHRAAIAALDPRARSRTFLMLQFARLAEAAAFNGAGAADVGIGAALLHAVRVAQGTVQPAQDGADELVDPVSDPARRLPACAEQIERAVLAIVRAATRA